MAQAASILLGRYELGEQIGGGGFSEVWEGTDLALNRPVAIKMLHVVYAEHAETLARFRAEARHAASVSHGNIARVYDYGEADPPNPPFLVMEFVAGPSLAQVLAGGAMDPARTMKIVAQAAAGLQAAHRAGLVHRDIKPGNLLLAPGDVVKITDFGIAHAAGSAPVTSTGLVIGTAGYLAPERVAGSRGSPASDLYALGVIAYECLAGAAPFTGAALEVAVCHRERPLPALPASVPADVAALVSELTAKDPAARPGSAGAVARRAAELADRSIAGASAAPYPRPAGRAGRPAPVALPPTRVEPIGVRAGAGWRGPGPSGARPPGAGLARAARPPLARGWGPADPARGGRRDRPGRRDYRTGPGQRDRSVGSRPPAPGSVIEDAGAGLLGGPARRRRRPDPRQRQAERPGPRPGPRPGRRPGSRQRPWLWRRPGPREQQRAQQRERRRERPRPRERPGPWRRPG